MVKWIENDSCHILSTGAIVITTVIWNKGAQQNDVSVQTFVLKKLSFVPRELFFHIWSDITLFGSRLNVFLLIFCHFVRWKVEILTKTCRDWSYEIIHILSAILKCTRIEFWENLENYTGSPTNDLQLKIFKFILAPFSWLFFRNHYTTRACIK